jgi:Ca2+:H+ antiporter
VAIGTHPAVRASILAVVPLAALLSLATESVAARTGDAAGGLLNATLGNLTELVIALTALQAGQYLLVKASIAGAIVTNTLFMLGGAFLFGGLRHHVQELNRISARFQRACCSGCRRVAGALGDQPGGPRVGR